MSVENQVLTKTKITVPKKWNVIFHNDDKTSFDVVIHILKTSFGYFNHTAMDVAIKIHNQGSAIVGTYYFEVAQQKQQEATQIARSRGAPLRITIEED